MNISKNQFEILSYIEREGGRKITQRELAERTCLSLGLANRTLGELDELGLVSFNSKKEIQVTKNGLEALEPYRVKRAVIIAAGFGGANYPEYAQAAGKGARETDCGNAAGCYC